MQKGNLLLFAASLGIVWVHASSTSAGYCCHQITVALGTEGDGTYHFLAEGKGPAMKECQDACIYSKDSNQTDLYCFEAVTSAELGNGQVQCEAISPYSLLMSTTPAVTGPTAEELLKKIEDLQKDFEAQTQAQGNQTEALKKDLADQSKKTEDLDKDLADQTKKTEDLEKDLADQIKKTEDLEKDLVDQTKKTEDLEKDIGDQTKKTTDLEKDLADQTKLTEDLKAELKKDLADQTRKTEDLEKDLAGQTKKTDDLEKEFDVELKKEVEAREAEAGKIKTEIDSIDGRLKKTEKKEAVCGFKSGFGFSSSTTLKFDRVYDEVDLSSGGRLEQHGYFTAGVAGVYYITLKTMVGLNDGEYLTGSLQLSSGNYAGDGKFIQSKNAAGSYIDVQASASRYVKMAAGDTMHISLDPNGRNVEAYHTIMCVSLYSASG